MQNTVDISLSKSQILKGLAIIAVVMLHFMAYLEGVYTTSRFQLFFISLDQLGRFCVPLFVMLSGYGLTLKYKTTQPEWIPFIEKRVRKLLPLYVLWSVVFYFLLSIVPAWQSVGPSQPFWYQILTGNADYQLYFVVLIFQLYAIFPLFLRLVKKYPTSTLLLCFGLQLALFTIYSSFEFPGQNNIDGLEYPYFGSWIGYFVLGIWLVLQPVPQKVSKLFLPLALCSATIMIWSSWYRIGHDVDPLLALKFTRWPVLLYAMFGMLWITTSSVGSKLTGEAMSLVRKVLYFLGKESYLIFLAHTIGLRIIFSIQRELISIPFALLLTSTWIVTIVLSKKLNRIS